MGHRGTFIALVGPDGSGKTTLSSAIEHLCSSRGLPFRYIHWRPGLATQPATQVPASAIAPPPKAELPAEITPGMWWASLLRLARSALIFNAYYLIRIRPLLKNGCVVVADRWAYNYLAQPRSVRYYGPARAARFVVHHLIWHPDHLFVLTASSAVIRSRKTELTAQEIRDEARRWELLAEQFGGNQIDATQPADTLAAIVLDAASVRQDRA